jgi:hypothetical protein
MTDEMKTPESEVIGKINHVLGKRNGLPGAPKLFP